MMLGMAEAWERILDAVTAVVAFPLAMHQLWFDSRNEED